MMEKIQLKVMSSVRAAILRSDTDWILPKSDVNTYKLFV